MQTSETSDRTDRIADLVDNLLRENDMTLKQHRAVLTTFKIYKGLNLQGKMARIAIMKWF